MKKLIYLIAGTLILSGAAMADCGSCEAKKAGDKAACEMKKADCKMKEAGDKAACDMKQADCKMKEAKDKACMGEECKDKASEKAQETRKKWWKFWGE